MGFGTKHRQQHIADLCKQHLREKYHAELELVHEFIHEFENNGKTPDLASWTQFTDAKRSEKEMLQRLDEPFERWLNP